MKFWPEHSYNKFHSDGAVPFAAGVCCFAHYGPFGGGGTPCPLFVALMDLVIVSLLSSGESTPWRLPRTEPMCFFPEFVLVGTMGEDVLSVLGVSDLRATQV